MLKRTIIVACGFALLAVSVGHSGSAKITATDDRPKTITLAATPKRIVSLAPTATEYLYAAGLRERIVGVTEFCKFPPDAVSKKKVGNLTNPSLETILALKPDLVVAAKLNPLEVLDRIEALHIPVFGTDPNTLEDVLKIVERLARLGGTENQAQEFLKPLRVRLEGVKKKMVGLNPDHRPTVFYLLECEPIFTAGKGSIVDEIIALAGGVNAAHDLPKPWGNFSMETLVARNPDVLVISGNDADAALKRAVEKESRFQLLSAVKKNRVIAFPTDWIGSPTPRAVEGMEKLAKYLHPQLFAAKPKK